MVRNNKGVGKRAHADGADHRGAAGELHQTAGGETEALTTAQGVPVADEILTIAEETGATLIVVGLRRRSAVAKALLGSNAQRLILEAGCPVLAVRSPAA